jgi:hypothetical protein
MLTLTSRLSTDESPDHAACRMRDDWAKLVRLIRKRWPGQRLEYLRVFEKTKNGWPHMHILMRAPFIPQRWLSAAWHRLHGAKSVDIRSIANKEHYLFYVTKYIGKSLEKFQGVTRWFRSKGYDEPDADAYKPRFFGGSWSEAKQFCPEWFFRHMEKIKYQGGVIDEYRMGYMRWLWPMQKVP